MAKKRIGLECFVGMSEAAQKVRENAASVASTNEPVLIEGETGVGKTFLARIIHEESDRREAPCVQVSTGQLAPALMESQLFGRRRGAYTGAASDAVGFFEKANGGTLILDDIPVMPIDLQRTLLGVLDDGIVYRIGDADGTRVDVRIIATSNEDLYASSQRKSFREDLFFRLSSGVVGIPPLRQRLEDLPELVQAILRQRYDGELPRVHPRALEQLREYHWPGNVRELRNVLCRAFGASRGTDVASFDPSLFRSSRGRPVSSLPPTFLSPEASSLKSIEIRILKLLATARSLTGRADIEQSLDISRDQALAHLKNLIGKGLVERTGRSRSICYRLTNEARSLFE